MTEQPRTGRSGSAGRVSGRLIPEATVSRLPLYLRALHALAETGATTVSSETLAAAAGVNSPKVRKDLSQLGTYGTRGVGYDGSTSSTRSPTSSASLSGGALSSSGWATSDMRSPATAGLPPAGFGWSACSTLTGTASARR